MRLSRSPALLALASAVAVSTLALIPFSSASAATGKAVQLDAGELHSCVVTPAGRVKCWGDNAYGQLGIGDDLTTQSSPVLVPGLDNVKQVDVGTHTSCAIVGRVNKLMCWGRNLDGILGDGTTDDRTTPVVTIDSGVKQMDFGEYHACALLETGRIRCWGANGDGQIGTGSAGEPQLLPTTVKDLRNVTSVALGFNYTCVTTGGAVKCWGDNTYGALGNGTQDDKLVPRTVSGLDKNVKSLEAGYANACAIVGDGRLKCWGDNTSGSVGAGTTKPVHTTPVTVDGMSSGVRSVDVGYFFACALKRGSAKCWGSNSDGQLGTGDTTDANAPQQVKTLRSGVASVQAGSFHSCALLTDDTARCWGGNWTGQTGTGASGEPVLTPTTVLL